MTFYIQSLLRSVILRWSSSTFSPILHSVFLRSVFYVWSSTFSRSTLYRTIKTVHKLSSKEKKSQQSQDSDPGLLSEKQECFLCAIHYAPPPSRERKHLERSELNSRLSCSATTTPTGRKWLLQQLISFLFQVVDVAASVVKSSFVQVFDAEVHLADVEGEAAAEGDGC